MSVQRLDRDQVLVRAVEILGLDSNTYALSSTEALCASLRRAASFLCPVSPRQLVDAVCDAVSPLSDDITRERVAVALDELVMVGDLLELRQAGGTSRLLYLGPPTFVQKHPGEYLLLGVRARNLPLLDAGTDLEVIYDAHMRSVLVDSTQGDAPLVAAGLHRMAKAQWAKAPRPEPSGQLVARIRELLAADESAPGPVLGLTIIDPAKPVQFYKGRWREPTSSDKGIFVGRRPQAYGAPLWCVANLDAGVPQAVLDLPLEHHVAPGWDEAGRIQAALDAENGTPHVYRCRSDGHPEAVTLDFFGPLQSWAERYLALTGWPTTKGPKALFSYRVPGSAVADAQRFLVQALWMTALKEDQ